MGYQPLLMIMFHTGQFRSIKHFYIYYITIHLRKEFPQMVSYNRFVAILQEAMIPKAVMLKIFCLGTYIDWFNQFKGRENEYMAS